MIAASMVAMSVATGMALIVSVLFRILRPRRDFVLLLFLVEGWIYLYLSPTVRAATYEPRLRNVAIFLQIAIGCLFFVPLIASYRWIMGWMLRGRRRPAGVNLIPTPTGAVIVAGVLAVTSVCAIWIAIRNGVLFRRIGPLLPVALARMPLLEFGVYRTVSEFGLTFLALGVSLLATQKGSARGIVTDACASIIVGVFFVFAIINSRLLLVLGLAFVAGMSVMSHRKRRESPWVWWRWAIVLAPLAMYGFAVIYRVRNSKPVRVESLAQVMELRETAGTQSHKVWKRLDGLRFLSEVAEREETMGAAMGRSWALPAFITFGWLWDPAGVARAKREFATESEYYLMRHYTSVANPTMDVVSTRATDLYANFGLLGLLLGGGVVGGLFAVGTCFVTAPKRSWEVGMGLLLLARLVVFEYEFIDFWTTIPKALPLIVLLVVLPPLSPDRRALRALMRSTDDRRERLEVS